jgi:hypothetical protein
MQICDSRELALYLPRIAKLVRSSALHIQRAALAGDGFAGPEATPQHASPQQVLAPPAPAAAAAHVAMAAWLMRQAPALVHGQRRKNVRLCEDALAFVQHVLHAEVRPSTRSVLCGLCRQLLAIQSDVFAMR